MQEIKHEQYRNFWKFAQVRYPNGQLWWHIYRRAAGDYHGPWKYVTKKRNRAKCKSYVDALLLEEAAARA